MASLTTPIQSDDSPSTSGLKEKLELSASASSTNAAILTEEKAAFLREGQKKKKAKARSNKKVAGKKK